MRTVDGGRRVHGVAIHGRARQWGRRPCRRERASVGGGYATADASRAPRCADRRPWRLMITARAVVLRVTAPPGATGSRCAPAARWCHVVDRRTHRGHHTLPIPHARLDHGVFGGADSARSSRSRFPPAQIDFELAARDRRSVCLGGPSPRAADRRAKPEWRREHRVPAFCVFTAR